MRDIPLCTSPAYQDDSSRSLFKVFQGPNLCIPPQHRDFQTLPDRISKRARLTAQVSLPPFETAGSSASAPSPSPLLPSKPPTLGTTLLKPKYKATHIFWFCVLLQSLYLVESLTMTIRHWERKVTWSMFHQDEQYQYQDKTNHPFCRHNNSLVFTANTIHRTEGLPEAAPLGLIPPLGDEFCFTGSQNYHGGGQNHNENQQQTKDPWTQWALCHDELASKLTTAMHLFSGTLTVSSDGKHLLSLPSQEEGWVCAAW